MKLSDVMFKIFIQMNMFVAIFLQINVVTVYYFVLSACFLISLSFNYFA